MFWWILYSTVEMDFWRKHPFEQGNKLVNRPSDSMGLNRKSVSFENRIQSSRFVLLFVVWAFVLSAKQTTDFCLSLRTSFIFCFFCRMPRTCLGRERQTNMALLMVNEAENWWNFGNLAICSSLLSFMIFQISISVFFSSHLRTMLVLARWPLEEL